jgi:cytochrome c
MVFLRMQVIIAVCFFVACSSSKKPVKTPASVLSISRADSLAGLAAVRQSDCITCHDVEKKLQGPAFSDVANRYYADTSAISKLAAKIISGGKGSWGDLPIVPHPSMKKDRAMSIVKYILSLKK